METPNGLVEQLDKLALEMRRQKGSPSLILYYHEYAGDVRWDDVGTIYDELRRGGFSRENKIDKL